MTCSNCDRGYHTFCITPNLDDQDKETWKCQFCKETTMLYKPTSESPEPSLPKSDTELTCESPTVVKSPFRGRPPGRPGRRRKTPKFAHIKKSKYRISMLAKSSDNNTASTESEDSDACSVVDRLSSPVKGSRIKKKCPTQGCDGLGHYTGKFDLHHTVSGCPMYHNTTAEECKVSIHFLFNTF